MNRFFRVVLCAVLTVGFLGGALTAATAAPKLRIGIHRSLWGSYEVIADRKGYWKEAGLDYTVGYFKQGKLMRNAVIQGNLDTGTTGFSPFTTVIAKGAKVQAIAVTASICEATVIVVPKNSNVKSLKELKGKRFANSKGTSTDFTFQAYVLPSLGLKTEDFPILNVNATERISAVVAGTAAAAMVGEPQAEIAIKAGFVRPLETLCKYDNTRMMHIGNPETIKAHPEMYEKYFKGWLKAHRLLKENPEEYARVYTAALLEVGDKAKYDVILPVLKKLRTEVFLTDEVKTYLNDMGDKQIKLGWIRRRPDFTKSPWINDSILRKVAKDVGFN